MPAYFRSPGIGLGDCQICSPTAAAATDKDAPIKTARRVRLDRRTEAACWASTPGGHFAQEPSSGVAFLEMVRCSRLKEFVLDRKSYYRLSVDLVP